MKKRLTRGQVIKQMCLICNGWNPDQSLSNVSRGMARKAVKDCAVNEQTCPLYPFRLGGKGNKADAIKLKCYICMGFVNKGKSPVSKLQVRKLVRECKDTDCPLFRYRLGKEEIPS